MLIVDIVIPSAGRPRDLGILLASLDSCCQASRRPEVRSITVTDDRHADSTAELLRRDFPGVRYVAGPRRGPAANRNHGASLGQAPWILFLDDDCYTAVDLLAAYAATGPGADGPEGYLEGSIASEGPRPSANHHAPLNPTGGRLWACNFMIRREVFHALGGFDERFPHAALEDCDLLERLTSARIPGRFVPEATVIHPWRSVSASEIHRQIIGHAIMADKHPGFAAHWSPLNLLRMLKARLTNGGARQWAAVPASRYRAQAYFALAPVLMYLVVHAAPLRRRLVARHANRFDESLLP